MKVTLESTDQLVELQTPTGLVPARIWEGRTAGGIQIHAFITRVAVHQDHDAAEFERELQETPRMKPSPELVAGYHGAIPARLVL